MKINIRKNSRVETVELTQFQKNIYDSIRKEKYDIFNISKSRQVGVSTVLAYYCLERLFLSKQTNILVRSHSSNNSERFISLIRTLYELNFKSLTNQKFIINGKNTLRVGNVIITTNKNMFQNNYPIELILDEHFTDLNREWIENINICSNFSKIIISYTQYLPLEDLYKIHRLFRYTKYISQLNLDDRNLITDNKYITEGGICNNNKENILKSLVKTNHSQISDNDFRKIVNILYGTN